MLFIRNSISHYLPIILLQKVTQNHICIREVASLANKAKVKVLVSISIAVNINEVNVGIVGAGVSGLYAALMLRELEIN
ncbi:hypothetical protein B4U80_14342 [Leptotrombidium deliense]|uniref:Uncharacterized protein n=1 Tax=Leptotrombidium deliense TaxID=299467 RepID=A0A443RX77_9ACAR|nr:hypothetical protein B4U80_14342 [Leptotrombidium deliense]